MRKATPHNQSFAGQATRLVAAATLACSLAAFGCSTDRTPGSGEPQRFAPSPGPTAPSSSSTPGSEGTNINPPMTSAYSGPAGSVYVRHVNTDAVAIAAANQAYRGRVLGPADPGGVAGSSAGIQTGQFISPSMTANPQITVNSSISSDPTPVITSGGVVTGDAVIIGGGGVVSAAPAVVSGTSAITNGTVGTVGSSAAVAAMTNAATTANTVTTSVNGTTTIPGTLVSSPAPIIGSTALVTPTTAGAAGGLTVGQFAAGPGVTATSVQPARTTNGAIIINNNNGSLTPTISSGATISPTLAANGFSTSRATTVSTAKTAASTTTSSAAAATTTRSASAPLVIGRSANGSLTVTNIRTVGDRLVTTTSPVNNNASNLRFQVNH